MNWFQQKNETRVCTRIDLKRAEVKNEMAVVYPSFRPRRLISTYPYTPGFSILLYMYINNESKRLVYIY